MNGVSGVASVAKKRIVVVCPGRGSYTKENLGYLRGGVGASDAAAEETFNNFLADLDERRVAAGDPAISELDNAPQFKPALHTRGEHASALIYACAYKDFLAIDRDKYEIAAICGNSMGWYLTLAFGQALNWAGAFHVIQTMGSMMRENIVGGQIIYPVVNEHWQIDPARVELVRAAIAKVNGESIGQAYQSIFLGGYAVIGGDTPGLQYLLKNLPKEGDYPFQLINHAAFHTPLLSEISAQAFNEIPEGIFHKPLVPLIDGRGKIWQPYSTRVEDLYDYTLGHQVFAAYDFTATVTVALKEFAPDHLVLLGPGGSLGGAIGQTMILNKWNNMESKADFQTQQKAAPFLLSMGIAEQRAVLV
jgi:[acyl-carrier-protein] S-malonyltransferase